MSPQVFRSAVLTLGENPIGALLAKATLVLVAALLLIRLTRGASASSRHLMAAAAFGVLLLLPLATLIVPARVITVATKAALVPSKPPAVPQAASPSMQAWPPSSAEAAGLPRFEVLGVVRAFYIVGSAWLLVLLLGGVFRLHRLRNRAQVSVEGTRLANAMARALGRPGGIEVVVSSQLSVPMTFGFSHPVILLPAETAHWEQEELGRALRHELEHVTRGDWAAHVVSRFVLALYWPHPLAWVLWRHLRLEAERACDDAVIRSQGQAESYAHQLVTLAQRLRGHGSVPALSMATRSTLGLRVDAILDNGRRRAGRSRLTSILVGAMAVIGVWTLAPYRVMGDEIPVANEESGGDDDGEDSLDVALLQAAEKGSLQRMRRLIDQGARANAAISGEGSPLIAAARGGHVEAMALLIDRGADVNRGVGGDGSPLIAAARGGHLEAARWLLDRGADIDLDVPGDGNALIMAAGEGQLEMVRLLLDRGASLEQAVPGDENALIHASESGQAEVVRLLLDRGADVNARIWAPGERAGRGEWRTALVMARRHGHQDVVQMLLAKGARE